MACLLFFTAACEQAEEQVEDIAAQQEAVDNDNASAPENLPVASHPNTEGADWEPLFSSDLSNAVLESQNSWVKEDNVLYANDHSPIWTKEEYGNFVLDVELQIPENTNSGIFLRTPNKEDILSGLEIQIFDEVGDSHSLGAVYDLKAPSGGEIKPTGEWNQMTITAYENKIYVVINGEQAIDMDLNNWTEAGVNPDGTENKFGDRAIKDQVRSGLIGIQGIHGQNEASVKFRNLKIKELESGSL